MPLSRADGAQSCLTVAWRQAALAVQLRQSGWLTVSAAVAEHNYDDFAVTYFKIHENTHKITWSWP